jgi:hypothetical protein
VFTRKLLIFLCVFWGFHSAILAQKPQPKNAAVISKIPVSNLHKKFIKISKVVPFDSLSIIPQTFSILGFADSAYTLDYINATISWKKKPSLDSVFIAYRTFPYKLNAVAKRLNYDSIRDNFMVQQSAITDKGYNNDNFFNFGNITYNGSFGRSISFGNSQDAVVTSNLNLQISGYLADSIQISAALTDNNIPIQPDGTTAQLNDFDKIFLQFKKKTWALSMGDIDLRQNQNYFLNFYKRLEGASFETTDRISDKITNKALVSGAIAKGKFNRNIFQGQEGNQGPYRLTGANNELYFVVLAGTEKVYIDGQMLQRGADQDYIINYNTAEVTFMPKRMITQDSRIQVEFEYSDQNYLNVNLYLYDEANFNNKLKLRFGVFSNSDSRNSPINQTLDADQKKFLNQLGDSVQNAFYPVAPLDTLGPGKVLYQKIDTTYIAANGLVFHDSIYIYSVNPNVNLYNLAFADVGQGKGDYLPNLNGVNGSVYQWVAPVNGVKQGQFEAAQFLVTPKTQRIVTLGADYILNKRTTVTGEIASSHYDVNTLSSIGKTNDDGFGTKFLLKNIHPFGDSSKALLLTTNLGYEYVQSSFAPLEPLRTVEFTRDWGLPLAVTPANETLYNASFELSGKKKNMLRYEFAGYNRGSSFNGIRNSIINTQEILGWHIKDQISLVNSNGSTTKGYYLKPSIDISRKIVKLNNYLFGINYSIEHNESRDKIADTVFSNSFAYETFQAYLKSPDQKPNQWGVTFTERDNSYPYGKQLAKGDRSKSINLFANLLKSKHHQLRFNATYRDLQILNTAVTSQQPDKSLLGRAEYIINEWKGLITGNALFEVGSGQEQKKTYSYLQVPAGTGQYAWIDLNNDGIQQLNEFVLAQFPDQALFIRIYTPTNDYIKANYNTFNYSFNINPRAVINPLKSKGIRRIIGNVTLQSSLQLNQKEQATGFVQLNPLKKVPLTDTSLITRTSVFTNTFSYNKASPKWGFDINKSQNTSKTLLTYGYESRNLNEWTLRTHMNFSRALSLTAIFKTGVNQLFSSSSDIDSSDYSLKQYSIEPDLIYTRGSNLRILIGYKIGNKKNDPLYGLLQSKTNSINSEVKYNILQSTSLQAKFTYSNINFTAKDAATAASAVNSPVGYVILDGLLPGKNYLWNLDLTKKLGGNLELNIQYEGRKPGEGRTIHTGRASLRALL